MKSGKYRELGELKWVPESRERHPSETVKSGKLGNELGYTVSRAAPREVVKTGKYRNIEDMSWVTVPEPGFLAHMGNWQIEPTMTTV